MQTTSSYNEGQLQFTISGRVDTVEASRLQDELMALLDQHSDVQRIVVDATNMEFISSTGLRVFLMLKKRCDDLLLQGVEPQVYRVFQMTGFHKVIRIEKALEQVSIEGCTPVQGLTDVYIINDDTMLRLFPADSTKADVTREIALAKEAFVRGIPTSMVFDAVRVGQRFGLMYERSTPTEADPTTMGQMLAQLHQQVVEPEAPFHSLHQAEKERIQQLRPLLGDDAADRLQLLLGLLPEGSAWLHGRLSPDSIRSRQGEYIFGHMIHAGYGNPVLDLAYLCSHLTPEQQQGEYLTQLLSSYYSQESADTIQRQRQNIVLMALVPYFTRLLDLTDLTPQHVQTYQEEFQERVVEHWDEILSHLHFKMDFNEEIRRLERQKFYLESEVDIDWIAKRLGTNRHYVSDYFNKVLHTPFNTYINDLRLDYALRLMREGRIPPSQICYEAGFNSDHTFRRLFKQKFGCTPSQYQE